MPEPFLKGPYDVYERRMIWAASAETGSSVSKLLLMTCAVFSDHEGVSWMSQEQLAGMMEVRPETVSRHMAQLEQQGRIRRWKRFGKPDLVKLTPPIGSEKIIRGD